MESYELSVNNKKHSIEAMPEMPLLWVIRDLIGLTGTKYGCGIGQCGSCTVHLDGKPIRSCLTTVDSVGSQKITTIEGLSPEGKHPVQVAWVEEDVPQCGYCQAGQVMSAVALLEKTTSPSDAEIDDAMSGNLCRCGTYTRIRKAIKRAGEIHRGENV